MGIRSALRMYCGLGRLLDMRLLLRGIIMRGLSDADIQ